MKNILIAACAASAAFASYAADLDVSGDITIGESGPESYDNININADALVSYADNINVGGGINVASGVSSTLATSVSTSTTATLFLGVDDDNAFISGAGKNSSALLFKGRRIGDTASTATATLNISDITFQMQRWQTNQNMLYFKAINVSDSVFEVLKKADTSSGSETLIKAADGLSFTNSEVIIRGQMTTQAPTTFTNSSVEVYGNYVIESNTLTTFVNSSINKSANNTIAFKGLSLSGTNEFKGTKGDYTNNATITTTSGASTYIALDGATFTLTAGEFYNNGGALYIGVDALGNAHDTAFNGRIENRSTFVAKGNTTISGQYLNLRGTVDIASGVALVSGNSTTTGQIRLTKGFVDGSIAANGRQYNTTYGWDYSLGLGVWGTTSKMRADGLTLGANATANVAPTVATFFSIYGDVVINSGEGAIVSNANAPLYIYDTSNLTLNSTDAFAVGGAATQAASTFNIADGASAKLIINADNNIGTINLVGATSYITLDLAGGNLTLGGFAGAADIMNVILGDELARGVLKITDMDDILANYASQSDLTFMTSGKVARTLGTDLFIEEVSSGVYTVFTQIPEPSAFALIFGALALALALRGRK